MVNEDQSGEDEDRLKGSSPSIARAQVASLLFFASERHRFSSDNPGDGTAKLAHWCIGAAAINGEGNPSV